MGTVHTLDFSETGTEDHDRVGGKCASLGDMTQADIAVPPGFAVTTDAYEAQLAHGSIQGKIEAQLNGLDTHNLAAVNAASHASSL